MSRSDAQLSLPFCLSEDFLTDRLRRAAGKDISLTITDNSSSMISVMPKGARLSVRIHRIFLQADDALISEIAAFVRRRGGKTPLIGEFIRRQSCLLKESAPRRCRLNPAGKIHDLAELARTVNEEYFGGRISAAVTWGARRRHHYVRRRTLGSYSIHTNTIRINRVLDRNSVPRYFVRFIIYHEMLHADIGPGEKGGRRTIHSAEFRRKERMFKEYSRALSWEREKGCF